MYFLTIESIDKYRVFLPKKAPGIPQYNQRERGQSESEYNYAKIGVTGHDRLIVEKI